MKCVILGCGLAGLTSAYYLRRLGWEVAVIDRAAGPGLGASYANGSLLTPSMPEPWNGPGCYRTLLSSLYRSDVALKVRIRALPELVGWGAAFLKNSRRDLFEQNTISNLSLALHSLMEMSSLRRDEALEYDRQPLGTLRIFRDPLALDRASKSAERLSRWGLRYERLSTDRLLHLEPALAPIGRELAGGLYYPDDETGSALKFCEALRDVLLARSVSFSFDTDISQLESRAGLVTAMVSGSKRFAADVFVVAAGSYSAAILRRIGLNLPVQPAKGYSITLDQPPNGQVMRIPVVDDDYHSAIVPLGDGRIRVAGTAEFAGSSVKVDTRRVRYVESLVRTVLPDLPLRYECGKPWCGLRPMSADGVPIIGKTSIGNLYLNTGQGPLGWTMAAASGRLLGDLIAGRAPLIESRPYAPSRFNGL